MRILDIAFSKSHLTSPFTIPDSRVKFSTMEKIASVALSLLIGAFTFGIGVGGVINFYFITAAMKAKKLSNKQPVPENISRVLGQNNDQKQPLQEHHGVRFAAERVRKFNKENPTEEVREVNSVVNSL